MRADRSSRTAELAALARAAHFYARDELAGPDHLAVRFLPMPLRLVARWSPLRALARWGYARAGMAGGYEYVLARSRCFDGVVLDELANGIRQVVLLGAGFDSRAYRFNDALRRAGALAFELDSPGTSRRKRDLLPRVLRGELPDNVRWVEMDFNRQDLGTALAAHGFDPRLRSLFVWEGVTFYLTADAVDATLAAVGKTSPGSALVFDYLTAGTVDGTSRAYGANAAHRFVARRGEPFTFEEPPGGIAPVLARHGLDLELHFSCDELLDRYLTRSDGSTLGPVAGYYGIALARRPDEEARRP